MVLRISSTDFSGLPSHGLRVFGACGSIPLSVFSWMKKLHISYRLFIVVRDHSRYACSKEAAEAVHREAHGLLAQEIIEVKEGA
jgi:hypothetical protein